MTTTTPIDASAGAAGSKAFLWIGRVLSALPALFMIFGVIYAFTHQAAVREQMKPYGYPDASVMPIIVVELVSLALYLIPQTAVLGAILLTGYFGGAVATHVRAGEPLWPIPVVVSMVFWLGLWFRDARVRALAPIRRL